jgi:hypothetical protein
MIGASEQHVTMAVRHERQAALEAEIEKAWKLN